MSIPKVPKAMVQKVSSGCFLYKTEVKGRSSMQIRYGVATPEGAAVVLALTKRELLAILGVCAPKGNRDAIRCVWIDFGAGNILATDGAAIVHARIKSCDETIGACVCLHHDTLADLAKNAGVKDTICLLRTEDKTFRCKLSGSCEIPADFYTRDDLHVVDEVVSTDEMADVLKTVVCIAQKTFDFGPGDLVPRFSVATKYVSLLAAITKATSSTSVTTILPPQGGAPVQFNVSNSGLDVDDVWSVYVMPLIKEHLG